MKPVENTFAGNALGCCGAGGCSLSVGIGETLFPKRFGFVVISQDFGALDGVGNVGFGAEAPFADPVEEELAGGGVVSFW